MTATLDIVADKFTVGDECWMWTASLTSRGYGQVWIGGKNRRAHRVIYELFNGPIPDGLDLDHLCHNADDSCPGGTSCPHRACVRPSHQEPATRAVNLQRGRTEHRTSERMRDAANARWHQS